MYSLEIQLGFGSFLGEWHVVQYSPRMLGRARKLQQLLQEVNTVPLSYCV